MFETLNLNYEKKNLKKKYFNFQLIEKPIFLIKTDYLWSLKDICEILVIIHTTKSNDSSNT